MLLGLFLGDVLSVPQALAGFSDSVGLMIAELFVVEEALVTTGIAFTIGEWLIRIGGNSEPRLVTLPMLTIGLAGAFIGSTVHRSSRLCCRRGLMRHPPIQPTGRQLAQCLLQLTRF